MGMPDVTAPITTYGDLKKAVQLWADRDDEEFVNQIPNFISFAQKEILRVMRVPYTTKEAYLAIINGCGAIPTDYLEGDFMRFASAKGQGYSFRETSKEEYANAMMTNPTATVDTVKEIIFARFGQWWYFFPAINANTPLAEALSTEDAFDGSEVVCSYYWDMPRYINDTDTDSLLQTAPELLLYGALKHAMVFTRDTDSEKMWADRQAKTAKEIAYQTTKSKMSFGAPVVKAPNANELW